MLILFTPKSRDIAEKLQAAGCHNKAVILLKYSKSMVLRGIRDFDAVMGNFEISFPR